jgi:predicted AlkP superfamily phosphohydrolase/phosphomutase
VKRRDELYRGPHVELAADLLIAEHDDSVWFYYSEGDVPEEVFEPSGWASGNHKPDGLFCAWGPDIRAGEFREGTSINDIMPTILGLMDIPIPDDVDGEVLRDIVRPGRRLRSRWTEATQYVSAARTSDAETDRAIEERLRGLGYLQ